MSILTINAKLPAKYKGFEVSINYNITDCLSKTLAVPFMVRLEIDAAYEEPVTTFSGNLRRVGPATQAKAKAAVKQGLAITRNQCGIKR